MNLHIVKAPLQRLPLKPRKLGATTDKSETDPPSDII
jgi:hypothetical protein